MARILIVDDEPLNLKLLHALLGNLGHEIVEASSGEQAIVRAAEASPDLVLLDVMMPGMSGIEAARRLKEQAAPQFLPVVLVTALSDGATRIQGTEVGVDDFIAKPIDGTFLKRRVANLLALRSDRLALVQQNTRLAELQRFRDEMTALLVHDMKNPASIVLTNVDFARSALGPEPDEMLVEALDDALEGCRHLIRLLGNVLDVARAEDGQLELRRTDVGVADLVAPIVQVRMLAARHRELTVEASFPDAPHAWIDPDVVGRVVENLLDNAFQHTPRGGTIRITGAIVEQAATRWLELTVANTGTPIAPESRKVIFDKYGQVHSARRSRLSAGLGLYFCRLATEAHGGHIWCEERADMPVVFVVRLPTSEAQVRR